MTTFCNLRDIDGQSLGIRCHDGRIAAIGPDITAPDAVDGAGRLVLPAFVEPHVHLDKTLWGEAWQPGKRAAKLRDYIENERRVLSANTSSPRNVPGVCWARCWPMAPPPCALISTWPRIWASRMSKQ